MPFAAIPLLTPPEPVVFDMQANLHDLPPLLGSPSPFPPPPTLDLPMPTPHTEARMYAGLDLASLNNIGSITNFSYTASNQSQYANWPIINYPITTSATNYNYIYNYQFGAQINPTAQIHYNYAPDPTGQYQYICTPAQYNGYIGGNIICNAVPETPEQKVERETRELAYTIKRTGADKRSEELLMCILNDAQKKQYAELGYFETEINDKIYRIKKGYSGNVSILKDGKEIEKYCA